MADAHANFAYGTVLTAPSPATSGTSVVLNSGQGATMPAPPFNVTIWPAGVAPTSSNAEIARCTVVSTDTLTITRAQESTSARTVVVGDQVAIAVTAKVLTDIETAAAAAQTTATAAAVKANNLSDLASAASARTNLGLGTAATHPVGDFAQVANNLSDLASAATARTNLGLGSAATQASSAFDTAGAASTEQTRATAAEALAALKANNLSDLASAATARTNLGLGTAATHADTEYSKIPLSRPYITPDPGDFTLSPSLAAVTTLLVPVFAPIRAAGPSYVVTQLGARVTTLHAANTFGVAIYSIVWTDTTHWSATLVCQLNAAGSTAATGVIKGDCTGGAAGSGAGTVTLDFVNNYYVIGTMASGTTANFSGLTFLATHAGFGALILTSGARSSTTDWPSTVDQTNSAGLTGSTRYTSPFVYTATGKVLP